MSVRKINPPAVVESDFQQMGEQLTAQYKRAVSGMVEVVKFGAMLHQVRENCPHLDSFTAGGPGRGNKGGLSKWLEEYAPEIKRATAYRFLGVAEAVMVEYRDVVGKRIADKYSLSELVLAENLPKQAQAKQLELFDYVSGTSQRSWLDRFKKTEPAKPRGGKRVGAGRPQKDLEAEAALSRDEWLCLHEELRRLMSKRNSFIHLERAELEALDGNLMDLRRAIKPVLNS